ncbi:MAG TPA: PilZ domain-containing protein [Allosphingosinicella sp.]|jgi:hypothetical protein
MGSQAVLTLVSDEPDLCRREDSRLRVLVSAKLLTTTDEFPVTVRDLSATGAKLEGSKLPPKGTDVILKRAALEVFATVVWRDGDRCGLQFEEPLTNAELLQQMNAPVPKAVPSLEEYRRPGLRGVRVSASELAAAREWAMPTGRQAFRG